MALMGLDVGTTGSKCTILDYNGNVLSYAYKEYPVESPEPGFYELNPVAVWNSVREIIYMAVRGLKDEKIEALSVSSIGEAVVPVDDKGKVLWNSILFSDSRGFEQAIELSRTLGHEKIMDITGLPVNSMYSLNKIMWLKDNRPDIFGRTRKFLLFEDFIIYMLTGVMAVDYSLASRTMAFDVVKKEWSGEILQAAGIDSGYFSEATGSGTIVGIVKSEISEELGLPRDTLVATGGHDQACAALGAGVIHEKMAVDGMGTAECITAAFSKPALNSGMIKNNYNCEPHVIDGMYLSLSFTSSGGGLLKWYRDNFASREALEAEKQGIGIYRFLDEKAYGEPTSLLVLPHFSGSGTPYMDPYSKGVIVGLTMDTNSSHIYRALMEGISFEMRYNLECLRDSGIEVEKLRAVGGGAKSDLWLQIKADIMDIEIETLHISEAGTLGTVILAGVASGAYASHAEAVGKLVRPGKVFTPNETNKKKYDESYQCYKKIYDSTRKIYA